MYHSNKVISHRSPIFFIIFNIILQTLNSTMEPTWSAIVTLEVLSRRKVKITRKSWIAWSLPEVEFCSCSYPPFKINESSMRTHVKKEKAIHEALTAAILAAKKICPFLGNTFFFFNLILKMPLLWGYGIVIRKKHS